MNTTRKIEGNGISKTKLGLQPCDLNKVTNDKYQCSVRWSRKYSDDLKELSIIYYESSLYVFRKIYNADVYDSSYHDSWFWASSFMFRHSIELIIKSAIAKQDTKTDFLININENKHCLTDLLKKANLNNISSSEKSWLINYIDSVDSIDKKADLFRYAMNENSYPQEERLRNANENYLDITNFTNSAMNAFNILHKSFYKNPYTDNFSINPNYINEYLSYTTEPRGNCQIHYCDVDVTFTNVINGFNEASQFLFDNPIDSKNSKYMYPIFYLQRHAIEVYLKYILLKKSSRLQTHGFKELWGKCKPLIKDIIKNTQRLSSIIISIEELKVAEQYIMHLETLDKNSSVFRYPFNNSGDYTHNQNQLFNNSNMFNKKQIFDFFQAFQAYLEKVFHASNGNVISSSYVTPYYNP